MILVEDERAVILRIIRNIDTAESIHDQDRALVWESCWREHASPPYFGDIVRKNGYFYHTLGYEQGFLHGLFDSIMRRYLKDIGELAEFGCGAGNNLLRARKLYPDMKLTGYDLARSAVERVKALGIEAHVFDMLDPHPMFIDGTVLTVHAMEQLGTRWRPFLGFLLRAKPKLCIHIEPLYELYDPDDLLDNLAMRYHERRGYLRGFLPALKEKDNVEILECRRTNVGGLMHEAYSVLVWRPK